MSVNREAFNESELFTMPPLDYLRKMFDRTDPEGLLIMPDIFFGEDGDDDEVRSLLCRMEWDAEDAASVANEYESLTGQLGIIASLSGSLSDDAEENRRILPKDAFDVWDTYIRGFDTGDIDQDRILEIWDRLDSAEEARKISKSFAETGAIDEDTRALLISYLGDPVTPEERRLFDIYSEAVHADSAERVGDDLFAYQEVIRAKRVCALMRLGAPQIVVNSECCRLAAAMALHRFCEDIETASVIPPSGWSDGDVSADVDSAYRPMKTNSRKSLAPLFVYLILKEMSGPDRHMTQAEILKALSAYPFEVELERKALSRIIHNLTDSGLGIRSAARAGAWYEAESEDPHL